MKVAVVGVGAIGRAWAISFLRAGHEVRVWNRSAARVEEARALIETILPDLEAADLLRGRTPAELMENFVPCGGLEEALVGAGWVQESVAEDVEVKRTVFAALDRLAPPDAILASSTSGIVASRFNDHLARPDRVLVAHPLNPPYLVPAVDLVPSPATSPGTMEKAAAFLRGCGQVPILMEREDPGFVTIRLQGMMYHACWQLVASGLADPGSVDVAVREGLGLRWSFIGPFETADLNAPNGIRQFVDIFGRDLAALYPRDGPVEWSGALMDRVEGHRREVLPMEEHKARQLWRDRRLIALAAHRAAQGRQEG